MIIAGSLKGDTSVTVKCDGCLAVWFISTSPEIAQGRAILGATVPPGWFFKPTSSALCPICRQDPDAALHRQLDRGRKAREDLW